MRVLLISALVLASSVALADPAPQSYSTVASGKVLANQTAQPGNPVPVTPLDPQGTWANRPTSLVAGQKYFATDIGSGQLLIYDGTKWKGPGGVIVLFRAMPNAALTGSTAETRYTAGSVTVPAGLMSATSYLRITVLASMTTSANAKTLSVYWLAAAWTSGATGQLASLGYTAVQSARFGMELDSNGSVSAQIGGIPTSTGMGSSSAALFTSAINTASTAGVISITGQLQNGGDTLTLAGETVELIDQ